MTRRRRRQTLDAIGRDDPSNLAVAFHPVSLARKWPGPCDAFRWD